MIIEIDNIYFFSKNNKLKFKLNFNNIISWSSQNITNTFLIRYENNNFLFFESDELNVISNKLFKNANTLCRLDSNYLTINSNLSDDNDEFNNRDNDIINVNDNFNDLPN